MTKRCLSLALLLASLFVSRANIVVMPWKPIFKGVDRAVGTNYPDSMIPRLQVANCVRVDLTDPDVQFFTTPRATNYVAESRETTSLTVSNFLQRYGLQVACTANFYNSAQGYDPNAAGVACEVYGLSMCTGQVVSVPDFGPDSNNRYASILFTTNKIPSLILSNGPPGTNTAGIYTAVSGYYPVLTNGVVLGEVLRTLYPDETIHDVNPRTVFGLSQDRRYFYMLIIDGRQSGYSDGALDGDSGLWLLQFGGWDGIDMDGGGSTAMYMGDCAGNPLPLGHSSYIAAWGRERYTGSHIGVYAPPLPAFINNVSAIPGSISAVVTWQTLSPASSQVEFGTTTNYGGLTPLDSTLVTNHSVTISGLSPLTRYYFRTLSIDGTNVFFYSCLGAPFTTTNFAGGQIFAITQSWKYFTGNLDSVNWRVPVYNDGTWPGGAAALWAHDGTGINTSTSGVPNLRTRMPINAATTYPFTTYYFRSRFNFPAGLSNPTLVFSNYIDDGAVFYLNGAEIYRTNMPAAPAPISNGTFASGFLCGGNATCPIVFNVLGNALTNLVAGTNVLAVEVHNANAQSHDITFETALLYTLPPPPELPPFFTNIVVLPGETNGVLTWNTASNSTTQIFWGPTPVLGSSSELDTNLVTDHAVVLNGFEPATTYYFRLVATFDTNEFTYDGTFRTTEFFLPLVTFSNIWRFTTNKLDLVKWMTPDYDDSGWIGQGPALLYAEDNVAVTPRNTPVPLANNGFPYPTYYFRSHFTVTNPTAGLALMFTNYIDDGAAFYLNGVEIQRVRMSPGPIFYTTLSSACPINSCEATVDVPDVFRLSGSVMSNLVFGGDNIIAAEVHQHAANSSDIVFGASFGFVRARADETKLRVTRNANTVCIEWDGEFLTLQKANAPGNSGAWSDVPGPVRSSPYCITNPAGSVFYRLRN